MNDSTMFLVLSIVILLCSIVGIVIGKPILLCGLMTVFGSFLMGMFFVALSDNQ